MRGAFLEDAADLRRRGVAWSGLPGDALAFVLAAVLKAEPCLVVVDEPDAAERLLRGLRFFLADPRRAALFPADDVRPYDGFSPSPEVPAARLQVLWRLDRGDPLVVVAPVRALMQRVPDRRTRDAGRLTVRVGDTLEREHLARALTATGYLAAARAGQPGTFALRGDVLDAWSPGARAPRRIDFFDDEVEEVRRLDPGTLKPARREKGCLLLPAREERVDDEALRRFGEEIAREVQAQGRGLKLRRRLIEELGAGIRFSAVEDWLPALVPTVAPLDALSTLPVIAVHPSGLGASARDFWDAARRRWADLDEDERPLVTPEQRYVPADLVLDALKGAHPVYELAGPEEARSLGAEPVEGMAVRGTDLAPVAGKLRKLVEADARVALVAPSEKRAQMLDELLEPYGIRLVGRAAPFDVERGEVSLLVGDLPRGFVAKDSGWAFVPATALFGGTTAATQRAHELFDVAVQSVSELKTSDLVVHRLHGIGRFLGLVRLDVGGAEQDFVKLEYRDGDLLYVPATSLDVLSVYTPSRAGVEARLDKLGGATWAARKGKVRDQLLAMAQELLAVQARRQLAERPSHPEPGPLYKVFVERFPHTETVDQARAIVEVMEDLSDDEPMDRLVCGDVGFGKTEVAMRAVMRVVEGGQQVAVLCPTTVLAFQHVLKFRDRFAGMPVRVEMLSRFSTPAEERAVVQGLADGTVDVVIGTHALLGRQVRWKRLGLVVVDEEHRFGVKQKERFKKLRAEVDLLSMSATPIPRTLQMALSGLREMSIMATPPEDRLAIRTSLARYTRTRVRDAILLELERGGQVFFVHNRIESIDRVAEQLREWVPEARFEVAHGQMEGEHIERILLSFMEGRFDVLVSTAIVESGIDLPNVNTMLVNRADLFGLSQLYQLRGRVGRGAVRGNCVLLTPEETTGEARRRLQVLVENTRLGSGFAIATADLELRGGGNVLGEAQSGSIDAVGWHAWMELLEEAVHAARGEAERQRIEPELEVPVPAFLPETLVPDVNERMSWYRRLSNVARPEDLEPVLDELEHERGDLPAEVQNLSEKIATSLLCRRLGIQRVAWLKVRAVFELHPSAPVTPAMLQRIAAEHPKRMDVGSVGGQATLSVRFTPREAERPFRFLRWVLARTERELREG